MGKQPSRLAGLIVGVPNQAKLCTKLPGQTGPMVSSVECQSHWWAFGSSAAELCGCSDQASWLDEPGDTFSNRWGYELASLRGKTVLGADRWCIILRICRLWSTEWRGTIHPHGIDRYLIQYPNSHFRKVRTPRLFWLKAQFQYTHIKKENHQTFTDRFWKLEVGVQRAKGWIVLHPRSWVSRR